VTDGTRGEKMTTKKVVGPKFDFFWKPIIPNYLRWPSFIFPIPFGELQNYMFWEGKK
jgi:hypothetical protein